MPLLPTKLWLTHGHKDFLPCFKIHLFQTYGQDGGVGRYTVPPLTTKRATTNLKTKNNQDCQKVKLWKSDNQGVKEETFILTGRGRDGQAAGAESKRDKVVAGRVGGPTFVRGYTWRNNWGARQTTQHRVPVQGNKASKPLTEKTCGCCDTGRNSQPHRRVCWGDP